MTDQTLYLVYETDAWHTSHSQRLCGIFTDRDAAVTAIAEHHNIPLNEFRDYFDEDEPLDYNSDWYKGEVQSIIRDELSTNNQTQGFTTNYIIESCTANDPWF